jgi:NADPH:quinone reductase-like Zn-dependent oxidoreductase
MLAVVLTKHGDFSVLQVQERPSPALQPGQVRIKVHAAGVNFADTMARVGLYPDAPKPPCVVGYEVAGEIVEGISEEGPASGGIAASGTLRVGARVIAGTRFGGYADEVIVKPQDTFPLPDGLSYEQGAAIPVNYVTAYAGLLRYGNLQRGEKVLLHAAAGGVGIAATQIAKHHGAEIWGTASPGKHDAIRGFGVDHPIDYTSKDFAREVRRISGEKTPLDIVMDAVGGSSFRKGYGLLRAGGRLVAYGASSVTPGEKRDLKAVARMLATTPIFHPMQMMSASKSVIGLNMLTLWDEFGSLDDYIDPLREWIDAGKIRPVVAEAFPLERGADAHRYMQERKNVGKVVLTL